MPAMAPPAIRLPLERPPEVPDPMELLLEWASSTNEVIVRRITAKEYILVISSVLCQEGLLIFIMCLSLLIGCGLAMRTVRRRQMEQMSDRRHTSLTHHMVHNRSPRDPPPFT